MAPVLDAEVEVGAELAREGADQARAQPVATRHRPARHRVGDLHRDDLRAVVATGETDDERMTRWVDATEHAGAAELPTVGADDDAYLIYTSGSTGRPKGIVHTHRSGWAYASSAVAVHGLRHDDRIAGMCPLHFDMSTLELYAAPMIGARVVVVGDAMMRLFLAEFTELCERESVTVWYSVPFFLRQLTDRGALDQRDLRALRLLIYAGEPFPPGALSELMAALPDAEVWNAYGPAETNVVTAHCVRHVDADQDSVPIGTPWPSTHVRLVAEDGSEVTGPGTGELVASSPTVMREYWKLPDLTAERLTPDADRPAWYATGDVVERDGDGLLWYRGRRDHQVKVRGVRLELEAIEAALTDAPGVAHAVAAAVGSSHDAPAIVAAVVARSGADVDVAELRRWCGRRLPAAAVPQSIAVWTSFPSTASGKIDRSSVRTRLDRETV